MHPLFLQVILLMPLKGPIIAAENGCRWTAMNGPSVPTKKCCRYPWMGPSLLWRNAANGHEWAHFPTKKCCRSPWLGPLSLLNSPTDGPNGLSILPRDPADTPAGPFLLLKNNSDGHKWAVSLLRNDATGLIWAHYHCCNMVPIAANEPVVSREKHCQYP